MRTHITGFDIRIDTEVSEEHTKSHSDQVRSVDSLKKIRKNFHHSQKKHYLCALKSSTASILMAVKSHK